MTCSILGLSSLSAYGEETKNLVDAIKNNSSIERKKIISKNNDQEVHAHPFLIPPYKLMLDIPGPVQRRLGKFARTCLQAILRAKENSGFEIINPERTGIIIGTAHGPTTTEKFYSSKITKMGSMGASPISFANSIHNSAASFIALSLGITGPISTIVNHELSLAVAIDTADNWLNGDLVDQVFVVVGDEYHQDHDTVRSVDGGFEPKEYEPLNNQVIYGEGFTGVLLGKETSSCLKISAEIHPKIESLELPSSFIIDAKGEQHTSSHLKRIANNNEIISYAKQYGSFTTSSALDLAIATYGLQERQLFASTSIHPEMKTLNHHLNDQNNATLIQIAARGEIGKIDLFY